MSKAMIGTLFLQKDSTSQEANGEVIHHIDNTYYFNATTDYTNIITIDDNQNIQITVNSIFDFEKIN